MNDRPRISVIIPVHDHRCLDKGLESLVNQTLAKSQFEVLIVDAEHALDWGPVIRKVAQTAPDLNIQYIKIPKAGRAAERNRGVIESRADLVLFIADDFQPATQFIEEHLKTHEKYPQSKVAVIGRSIFPSDLQMTPFMRWLEGSGNIFGVSFMREGVVVPPKFFYGANVSLKKEFLLSAGPFDEDLPYHAYDDYEMGERLFKLGMRTVFAPFAVAYHRHPLTLKERAKTMKEAGESAAILDEKTRQLKRLGQQPTCLRGFMALFSRVKLTRLWPPSTRAFYWGWVLAMAFAEGYNSYPNRHVDSK